MQCGELCPNIVFVAGYNSDLEAILDAAAAAQLLTPSYAWMFTDGFDGGALALPSVRNPRLFRQRVIDAGLMTVSLSPVNSSG